ncbi:sterol-sensing domain of SREBP cleavage-activation domain-containing protein [Hirsutella rhossiliensis]|uniref:Sterol regulatory element-binding protein cleavage-activating protein n=1 Tax=Hirsutella rhossiliensis TaxID=111463 RepID=A0A9P8SJG0_9HYPO|nr:sterol-sensing domain of SREBP cleavage-activation domain-containing protein [Hirsutella rhossiliensis]KAH0964861.1 sterol-sensing domain of SREBP cleavage-activation domain-containing protein [Hirsutella rhossiliensis]
MIWYLLYPLRGTTEAPTLPSSHPLRAVFARYGRYAACHVVATLLVTAAVVTILIYPIPFLFTSDFINGASNLPRHVWTVAQPLPYDTAVEPDITMRSMWVHASYMRALNADLLTSALELQDHLLGITKNFSPARAHRPAPPLPAALHTDALSLAQRDAAHVANGLTSRSWFFHSPLLYWGCSRERILADEDILSTVNDRKNQSTSANVTLRHSIVFSGKRFEDRRLLAADALVITLLHLRDSPVGREWEKRALELPQKVADKWSLYPADGRASSSQLYEFQFRPISVQDMITLALAYGLTLLYFLMSLSKLRAVKSKVGLIVTIMAQIIFSVMSSFTLCAIFKLDLSRIPRAAYPLVVLAMSLEHIFRLINAVIITPLEDSVNNRIGQAFGETAPTALASTLQNVLILAGLSRLVSPGVSEFCVFAAIAIVFDSFYLSTFFLAVLSVDVRRMELGDALAKASRRRNRGRPDGRANRRSWWDQVLQGKIAMSTRIAGTIVMFGFVLIAQWHFFGDEGLLRKLLRFYRGADPEQALGSATSSPLEDIHQARSPTSWLRMQDHETAREVINIIKPSSYGYVARVYDPLVFVLKDSDRTPPGKEPTLLPAAYDFIQHESARFIVIVIVVVAALRLLTNFLLWEGDDDLKDQHELDDSPLLSVKSMARGHGMDVILLAASADGLVVSVSLDHTIRAWSIRGMGTSYVIASGDEAAATIFPVIAMAIDERSKWLALLSRPKRAAHPGISFWNLKDRVWGPSVQADSCKLRPVALLFDPSAPCHEPRALVVQQDGSLTEIVACESTERQAGPVFPGQLTCARMLARKVSRQGEVCMASRSTDAWRCRRLAIDGREEPGAHVIEVLPALDLFVVAAGDRVHLINAGEGLVLQTLETEKMLTRPLRCAYTCHRLSQAGSVGLTSFTLGYVEASSGDCILQTFVPRDDCDAMFLQTPCEAPNNDWCTWDSARETRKRVADPGVWDMVSDGSAVGIRYNAPKSRGCQDSGSSGLRNRHGRWTPEPDPLEGWQVWTASLAGGRPEEDESQRLVKEGEQAEHLLVTEVGPRAKAGLNAVAFGFGDMVKLVIVGGQVRLDEGAEDGSQESWMNTGSRRRKAGTGTRTRGPT